VGAEAARRSDTAGSASKLRQPSSRSSSSGRTACTAHAHQEVTRTVIQAAEAREHAHRANAGGADPVYSVLVRRRLCMCRRARPSRLQRCDNAKFGSILPKLGVPIVPILEGLDLLLMRRAVGCAPIEFRVDSGAAANFQTVHGLYRICSNLSHVQQSYCVGFIAGVAAAMHASTALLEARVGWEAKALCATMVWRMRVAFSWHVLFPEAVAGFYAGKVTGADPSARLEAQARMRAERARNASLCA